MPIYDIAIQHIHADVSLTEQEVLKQVTAIIGKEGACVDLKKVERTCDCPHVFIKEAVYLVVIQAYHPGGIDKISGP